MILFHPEWDRSCGACETYLYANDGTVKPDRRTGLPMLRPAGSPTPCLQCPKVPSPEGFRGDWRAARKAAREMTDANRLAYAHYRRCRAVNRFPDDPIVSWCASLIRAVEDAHAKLPLQTLTTSINTLTARLGRK